MASWGIGGQGEGVGVGVERFRKYADDLSVCRSVCPSVCQGRNRQDMKASYDNKHLPKDLKSAK